MTPDNHTTDPLQPLDNAQGATSGQPNVHHPSHETQQQAIAGVARDQAQQAYQQQGFGSPYNQTHQPTYDWQQYHTAWQSYYQQYYQRYYAQQLQNEREQDRQKIDEEAKPQAPQLTGQTITGSDHIEEPKTRAQQIRSDLLEKVRDRAEKVRTSNHFIPIVCAAIIGLLFLALQFNRLLVAQVEAFISPGSTVDVSDTIIVDPAATANVGNDPKLIIPKINVDVPVVYGTNTVDNKVIQKALEKGTVHYDLPGANSVPGQNGNGVILGHSSNDVFDPGNYKFAFLLLDRLENGDLFYLNYQGKRYVYKVSDKKVIKPTEWQTLQKDTGKPTVILVTCTPAGTANDRLLVYGDQISPDPSTASAKPVNAQDANPAEIPGNSQTFFERLRDLFF
jgi:sortase A